MHRNWIVNRTNPEFLQHLSKSAKISIVFAQILVNRGLKDADSIIKFLKPSLDDMHDPFLLPDMHRAVERISSAVDRKETVLVHGDYDADGITSSAVLVSALRRTGLRTFYHIPNRITEGYGLSSKGIQKAKDCGAGLIITADCGISSIEEILEAGSHGMEVIITDHHEPSEVLPDAIAVIDPHRKDSEYPFRYLAGVGVAFKLVQAFFRHSGYSTEADNDFLEGLLDLVALGTIADSVPLTGENRIFAVAGLDRINRDNCRTGIMALKESAGVDRGVRSGLLSFTLIPRINAAGRLDDAGQVVELFLTDDMTKAAEIASMLDEQNRKRQKIEGDVLRSALDMLNSQKFDSAIVLSSPEWHPGVIGIVASRLVDMYYRPVFLFSENDSVAKGSARGIPSMNLFESISECSEILLGYGGHRQAAGLSIKTDLLPEFRERINSIVRRNLSDDDLVPVLEIDAAVDFSEINFSLVKEISLMEPFGDSNREPVFGSKDTEVVNRKIVGDNHIKMLLKQKRTKVDTIGFGMGNRLENIKDSLLLDIAFVPGINEWNGSRNIQLNLKAVRPSL